MPKSPLDWLAVVCIWIGGVVLAFRSAGAPLMTGMPTFFAAGFWNFIPGVLATVAMALFVYRQLYPTAASTPQPAAPERAAQPPRVVPDARESAPAVAAANSDILPAQISEEYLALKKADHTVVQEMRFLRPYAGKIMQLSLVLADLSPRGNQIRAQMYPTDDRGKLVMLSAIFALFDRKWEDHLQHLKSGDTLTFRARVTIHENGPPDFRDAEPV